jgi:hypothetical protein
MQYDLNSSNQPTAFLKNSSQSMFMIYMNGTANSSIFYCGFRGPNADITGTPVAPLNSSAFIFLAGPNGSGNQIVGNDFNGIGGYTAAIQVASASQQPTAERHDH